MKHPKILFTGPPGAGKTTAIAALSDFAPVSTEVNNTDTSLAKENTTVGLDFGQIDLGDGTCLRLFGTPGQERFAFLWKILAADALALIILLDNSRADPLVDLAIYVDAYSDILKEIGCVVGVGRSTERSSPGIADYVEWLSQRGLVVPVIPVDVRRRDDVVMLVEAALALVDGQT